MADHETSAVITASQLTKRYGRLTALDHVTFSVRRGEVLHAIPPRGAELLVDAQRFRGEDGRAEAVRGVADDLSPIGVILRVAAEAVLPLVRREGVVEPVIALLEEVGVQRCLN